MSKNKIQTFREKDNKELLMKFLDWTVKKYSIGCFTIRDIEEFLESLKQS